MLQSRKVAYWITRLVWNLEEAFSDCMDQDKSLLAFISSKTTRSILSM